MCRNVTVVGGFLSRSLNLTAEVSRTSSASACQGQIFVRGEIPSQGAMKTRTGAVEVKSTDTISQLLSKIFPPRWQDRVQVLWKGKQFRGTCALSEYEIDRRCTIQVVMDGLKGGMRSQAQAEGDSEYLHN
jgi:hypothetical protein